MGLLLFALLAGSAPQAGTATATPPPPTKLVGKKAGLVCVEETPIGSRLGGRRICRTAEEWQRDRQELRDDTERAQRLNKLPGQ